MLAPVIVIVGRAVKPEPASTIVNDATLPTPTVSSGDTPKTPNSMPETKTSAVVFPYNVEPSLLRIVFI